ncbi:MAG: hypothetical protein ACLFVC_04645 [Opitutales bacterium]
MSRPSLRTKRLTCALILAASLSSAAVAAAAIDLYRIPEPAASELERIPKNLARWHMGATLVLVKDDQFQRIQVPDVGYFEESVFLSDNSALSYSISEGRHDFIIDLGQFMSVSRFFLNNQSAGGSFQLMSSDTLEDLDSDRWVKLSEPVSFDKDSAPSVTFPQVDTRYILVRFEIEDAGKIGNFGATGPLKITQAQFNIGKGEETADVTKAQSPIIDYDFASSYTGTRIAYISGGQLDEIYHLIDEDPTTVYNFSSNDEVVIILDLRKATQFRTFTAQYANKVPGLVQVYMVDHLPSYFKDGSSPDVATWTNPEGLTERAEWAADGETNWQHLLAADNKYEVVSVPESFFLEIEDSYQARVSPDQDRAVQIFDELERRYVIFRFQPEAGAGDSEIESAVFRPGESDFTARRAQSAPISFGGVQVIGDVEFEDIFFTMESEQGEPGGPPEDPPDDPPIISQ